MALSLAEESREEISNVKSEVVGSLEAKKEVREELPKEVFIKALATGTPPK
jgi:hypothetical protein